MSESFHSLEGVLLRAKLHDRKKPKLKNKYFRKNEMYENTGMEKVKDDGEKQILN